MEVVALQLLLAACAPQVHADTALALVQVESSSNPWAIGVVGGVLVRQPSSQSEAISTARALRAAGWNFSVGLGQINLGNVARMGLTLDSAFEPCKNLRAMQDLLVECYDRAPAVRSEPPPASGHQRRLRRALSCYYSGNFVTGLRDGYVRRVVMVAASPERNFPSPTRKEYP